MSRLELAPEVLDDFERFMDHLLSAGVADAASRIAEIVQALQVLTHSPSIGRKVRGGKRELVIGSDSHGYVALYRFVADIDMVFVLAMRSQREAGYQREA